MSGARRAWARYLERHRRGVAALCAAAAVVCLGLALRPQPVAQVDVAVAAQALGAGHRLEASDVTTATVPAQLVPAGSASRPAADLVGSVLAAPVLAGEPLNAARLLTEDASAWSGEPGTAVLPVRFADAGAVGLLAAGQRIDVLAGRAGADAELSGPGANIVAADVQVLAVIRPVGAPEDRLLAGGSTGAATGSDLVVLAVTPAQALAIAAAEAGSRLTFVLKVQPPTGG